MRKRKSEAEGFVYLVTDDNNRIKIGVSKDVKQRIKSFKTANPKITLFGVIPSVCYKLEDFLHKELHEFRVDGEWFSPVDTTLLRIFSLVYEHGYKYNAYYIITNPTL